MVLEAKERFTRQTQLQTGFLLFIRSLTSKKPLLTSTASSRRNIAFARSQTYGFIKTFYSGTVSPSPCCLRPALCTNLSFFIACLQLNEGEKNCLNSFFFFYQPTSLIALFRCLIHKTVREVCKKTHQSISACPIHNENLMAMVQH